MLENFLTVKDLSYTWPGSDRPALNSLSFSVSQGEYIAVVGANGSGKSTLSRCINGLVIPPAESISVFGMDPSVSESRTEIRSRVAVVFQSPQDQIVSSVVEEDAAFGLENLGIAHDEMHERVEKALRATGLWNERARPTRFLSAGQQQRLAIAGVLAMSPSCIIFDEATSMIDPAGRKDVLARLDALVASGICVLHITHDMDEAARARRVLVLSQGSLVFDGSPADLFKRDVSAWRLAVPPSFSCARLAGMDPVPLETPQAFAQRYKSIHPEANLRKLCSDTVQKETLDSAGEALITFNSVDMVYLKGTEHERKAVDGLELSVFAGKITAIVGATGSGKSTVLQLADMLAFPSAGCVTAFGHAGTDKKLDPRVVRIAAPLCIQRPESALFETYAGDEAAFGPRNKGYTGRELVATVKSALDLMGLPYEEYRDRNSRSLSGGQKRRLALASVLAMNSPALLLDEPSSALDPCSAREIMSALFEYSKAGNTLFFATHDMEYAAKADFVAVMGSGKLLAFDTPANIFGESYRGDWGIERPFSYAVLANEGFNEKP